MNKRTPGPWVVDELVDGYDIHAPEAGCHVATASDCEMVWGAIGRKEDAHLIAAAPELLEALEDLLSAYQVILLGAGQDRMCREAVKATLAAISKAKGEE